MSLQKQLLKFFLITIISVAPLSNSVFAAEETTSELDSILDKFKGLSCETDGIGNLLRTEFAHTCIPAPFFTWYAANFISPGLYATALLRLTINDDKMFPGACDRGNRIDFHDQKLSFAMCNNIMLLGERLKFVVEAAVAIAKSDIFNTDPWEEIGKAWELDKADYHKIFRDKRENASGTMVDSGIIPIIPWKVIKENDKLCVATQSFSGWVPIGCKYIKEPYPVSIYADFMDLSPEGVGHLESLTALTTCGNMGGCYNRAYEHSRNGVVITGPLIECVKEMIAKLMISSAVCSFDDVNLVLGSSTRRSSALFQFQVNMHRIVSALLTIYVILFGFKVVLSGNIPEKKDMVNFAVKFLFVVYFSVGININVGSENDLTRMDGMIQWAFPFMLDGMTQMASWIINASPSDLCRFSDVYYPDNLRHLQLWDALDCRISHYIGLDALQNMIVENATRHQDFSRFDGLSNSIPPYVFLLIPAVISGNMTLISLAIMYPLLVISVGAFVVNATVVCMISIVILGVLAPLFVPLYLFNYTKGYFDSWVRLLLSFMLQPMVAVVFMTTMLSVYDFGFYGTCKYKYEDITYDGPEFSVRISAIGTFGSSPGADARAIRYFSLDKDWGGGKYEDQKEIDGCINSLGFMLNSPLDFLYSTGQELATAAKMPWIEDGTGEEDKKRFEFLNANQESPGMFFKM
ncbi:type IV secretion system protein, partial [Rickettsiaceae bacterium]|nr:type IV secretion system protein [Rickettsiaceae bacterium]